MLQLPGVAQKFLNLLQTLAFWSNTFKGWQFLFGVNLSSVAA